MANKLDEFYDYLVQHDHSDDAYMIIGTLYQMYLDEDFEIEWTKVELAQALYCSYLNDSEEGALYRYAFNREEKIDMAYEFIKKFTKPDDNMDYDEKEGWIHNITDLERFYFNATDLYYRWNYSEMDIEEGTIYDNLTDFFEENIDSCNDELRLYLEMQK